MTATGAALTGPTVGGPVHSGAQLAGVADDSPEARVLHAVAVCAARWGVDKTTVEDIAREAGMSRATVYRLYPGGKPAIVQLATRVEVADFLVGVLDAVADAGTVEDWLTTAVLTGSRMLQAHPVMSYMREHEPDRLRAFLSLLRLDDLLTTTGELLSPSLGRLLAPPVATTAAVWAARVVVSYYLTPSADVDPTVEADARRLVTNHLLAGLALEQAQQPSTDPSPTHQSKTNRRRSE